MKTKPQTITPLLQNLQSSLHFTENQIFYHSYDNGSIKPIAAESVRAAFSNQPIDSGWIPPNILRWGKGNKGQWMVEWIAPQMYSLTIEAVNQRHTYRVPMPSLIWFGQGSHFYIWAAKQKQFTPHAELFLAPLPNVNATGAICFGNKNRNRVENGGFDKAWELFWTLAFNHDHTDGKSRQYDKDITEQIKRLSALRATKYPLQDLVSMSCTLDQLINKFAKR